MKAVPVMRLTWSPRNRDLTAWDALGLAGWMGFFVARFIPIARIIPFWGCPLRQQTGWPCPGCGLTRVADRLAHFNFHGAWQANPLGTVAALFFAAAAVFALVHMAFKTRVPILHLDEPEMNRVRWTLGAVVFLNYAWVVAQAKLPALR